MPSFSKNEEGIKACKEYNSMAWNLYEQHRRDPDDPNEYIGLDDKEKEMRRITIQESNRILMERIEEFVEESRGGKPQKVLIYKDGRYRFSLMETIKAQVHYYIRKWRKREFVFENIKK